MAQEIEEVIGADEAKGYLKYVDFVSKLYQYEMKDFIDRNIDSPLDLTSRACFRQHNQMHQQLNLALLIQMDQYQSGNHLLLINRFFHQELILFQ